MDAALKVSNNLPAAKDCKHVEFGMWCAACRFGWERRQAGHHSGWKRYQQPHAKKQRLKQLQYVHRIELPTMAKCDRVKSGPWSCVRSKSINFSGPRESEIHRFAEI